MNEISLYWRNNEISSYWRNDGMSLVHYGLILHLGLSKRAFFIPGLINNDTKCLWLSLLKSFVSISGSSSPCFFWVVCVEFKPVLKVLFDSWTIVCLVGLHNILSRGVVCRISQRLLPSPRFMTIQCLELRIRLLTYMKLTSLGKEIQQWLISKLSWIVVMVGKEINIERVLERHE